LQDLIQDPLNRLKGLTFHASVVFFEHLKAISHHDGVDTDGTNIQAEMEFLHFINPIPSFLDQNKF
jgi:hypothetical protein